MFKFKGISSNDMQVVIEEEEHFIARAARRYEVTEIEGRDGAIFNELGYSYVERPIYVQCLNTNKIDDILAWLDGEGEFEYKGRKTTARFYSQLEPQRETVIRIIDTTFIRDPFWTKLEDEFVEVKGDKEKNAEDENINIKGTIPVKFKEFVVGGNSKQETRDGKNFYNPEEIIRTGATDEEGWITLSYNNTSSATVYLNAHHSLSDNIKPLTNYYLILEIKEVSGNADLVVSQYLSNSKSQIYTNLSENLEGLVAGQKKKYSVYSIENLEEAVYMLRTFLSVPAGENAKIVYRLSLIEQDVDIDNFEYEPYGVSPSPDYPSEIQNVEGDVNVTVCNKNIMKVNTEYYELTENGIKTTVNSVGKRIAEFTIKKGQIVKFGFKLLSKPTTSSTFTIYVNNIEMTNLSFTRFQDFNVKQTYETTYTATEDVKIKIILWGISNNEIFEFQLWTELDSLTDYVTHQEQTVTFPLSEGQKLYLGDYLAEDGIHHVRKQVELDGTEEIIQYTRKYPNTYGYRITIKGLKSSENELSALSSRYKSITFSDFYNNAIDHIGEMAVHNSTDSYVYFGSNKTTVEEFKEEVKGTVLEFTLAEEEIEPYTEEQEEAYNQICNLKAYEEETNIYSTDEISPIFKVTYIEETTEKIENEGNIYSRPILRLKKTSYNNVDLEIAGTRFQYNFNDESYIEIDCEEKTALYEGFNRNRQLTIGYEFPKLAPGENDIKMYEGDCIIEVKRKDRWL